MFGPKSLSVYLFYISRIVSIAIGFFLLFILVSFLTGNFELINNRFEIKIPLMETYIKGFYDVRIITTIALTLIFYILFFYFLSIIFKTFKAETLFTKTAIRQLNNFALYNLIGSPLAFILIHILIMKHTNLRDLPTYLLHLLLGVFIFFIVAIFKKGYKVQSENDLTI